MTTGRVDWRVRRPSGDLEIELHPRSLDAAEREASLRELRELVHEFKSRRPEVRRVVLEIYARVRGLAVGAAPADERVAEELLAAARAGVIGARRREIHAVAVPQDAPSSQVLGPASSETHVYKIRVYDDTGAPVAGVALKLTIDGGDEAQTTSGSGEVTVQKSDPGTATFTITNLDDIRDKLWPQWSKPLATTPPAADKVLSAPVTQPLSPQTAPSDWVVTLVLTRPPIWRVRMVGMIFDADKCFPSSSTGGRASTSAMAAASTWEAERRRSAST